MYINIIIINQLIMKILILIIIVVLNCLALSKQTNAKIVSNLATQFNYEIDRTEGKFIQINSNIEATNICTNVENHQLLNEDFYRKDNCNGYKYFNERQQVKTFIRQALKNNNLQWVELRIEDKFSMRVVLNSIGLWQIQHLNVQYLHPTITKQSIQKHEPNTKIDLSTKQILQQKHLSEIKLKRQLTGLGLHQFVNYTFTFPDLMDVNNYCSFTVQQILPKTTYIDVDQLGKNRIVNYEMIDIQKPAHFSHQYYYKYEFNFNKLKEIGINTYSYLQPVHFRYPKPSTEQYTSVPLRQLQSIKITCDGIDYEIIEVNENRGTAQIPTGNINQSKIVSFITFFATVIAALLFTKLIKNK